VTILCHLLKKIEDKMLLSDFLKAEKSSYPHLIKDVAKNL
jgi:hypothetical protein